MELLLDRTALWWRATRLREPPNQSKATRCQKIRSWQGIWALLEWQSRRQTCWSRSCIGSVNRVAVSLMPRTSLSQTWPRKLESSPGQLRPRRQHLPKKSSLILLIHHNINRWWQELRKEEFLSNKYRCYPGLNTKNRQGKEQPGLLKSGDSKVNAGVSPKLKQLNKTRWWRLPPL